MRILGLLTPRETVATIFEIDFLALRDAGMRAVLFDLDNTLEYGRPSVLRTDTQAFLRGLVRSGLCIGILSNRRCLSTEREERLRVEGIPTMFHAGKPRRRGYAYLMNLMGVRSLETVFIGDRRLTDIVGANRADLYSILVRRPAFGGEARP